MPVECLVTGAVWGGPVAPEQVLIRIVAHFARGSVVVARSRLTVAGHPYVAEAVLAGTVHHAAVQCNDVKNLQNSAGVVPHEAEAHGGQLRVQTRHDNVQDAREQGPVLAGYEFHARRQL